MASILDLGAVETAHAIAKGQISAVEAVQARIGRIESVNPKLNAVVWKRYEAALSEAHIVDTKRKGGEGLPPLAGVPITLKECIDLEGTPSTFGLPSRAHDIATADERHAERLRHAGAIVVGKTNVAQMLLFVETDNPLYGRTNNPWDLNRSPGGSSGGEGAILAARGSCLGLGTDLGGSVRIPAHVCGIAAIKPTAGRCPDTGRFSYPIGQQVIESQIGVMGTRVKDIALGLKIINLAGAAQDGPHAPLGDPEDIDLSKLTIGWYADDGVTPASPVVRRAVKEAAEVLRNASASVFEWRPTTIQTAQDLYYGVVTAGGTEFKKILGRNKADPRIAQLLRTGAMSNSMARAIGLLLTLTGQVSTGRLLRAFGTRSASEYWRLIERVIDYRAAFAKAMNDANKMDLILLPGFGVPAFPHGATRDPTLLGAHTILFNLLGYPAGVVPWTRVNAQDEGGTDAHRLPGNIRKVVRGSVGLPVGVQVAGRPWHEHKVLAVMHVLESSARKRPDFPFKPPI